MPAPHGFLFAKDQSPGTLPNSWYAATANHHKNYAPLDGNARADVCVVGGGYTGLSAALELAQRGVDVVLLEAHCAGWGASGRNGGQLGSGLNKEQGWLERTLGAVSARRIWQITQDAKALVRERIARHNIACDLTPGILHVHYAPEFARDVTRDFTRGSTQDTWPGGSDFRAHADHMAQHYDYDQLDVIGPGDLPGHLGSPAYSGGLLDRGAAHLHPLNLALGTCRAAAGAGARIHERTPVTGIDHRDGKVHVRTATGTVAANHVILACNAYLDDLEPRVARRVMPINNFIAATEPLDEGTARDLIRNNVAVSDSNFVINYFHLSSDRRMLFGGGETYSYDFPVDVAALVREPMGKIFPQLADVAIDYAWGGTLAITTHRLPYFARLAPNVWTASGYSGHGVAMANMAGRILADAVGGTMDDFDLMTSLPGRAFPGGARLRHPLLKLAMTWYALRDRVGL